ncbi:SDR family NAD(P)-dependent oxidoreductase [Lentzea sp. NPDC059081]|uniref:SDR family NAD(P)-dependent oxidoreductase n=1 Tax=Lentzea sp. NPDC059081 TaxID=3346719 RepID=UPI0036C21479
MTDEDIALFRKASGDGNPLHGDAEFARRTPFHEPIAHGVLACVAALDAVAGDEPVGGLEVTFRQPVYPGRRYECAAGSSRRITVSEHGRVCLDLAVTPGHAVEDTEILARPMRSSSADLSLGAVEPGMAVTGAYGPPAEAVRALAERWPVAARRLGVLPLVSLMWCSFLAGMEIPGRRGLLCRVTLRVHPDARPGALDYRAEVDDVDPRFGMVTVLGVLSCGGVPVAEAEIEAMVLDPAPLPSLRAIRESLAPGAALAGQTAVVVGGTRGLGAGLTLALADQGCRVLAGHRGTGPEVDALREQVTATTGELVLVAGDAGEPAWALEVRSTLTSLDLLVCNAAPAVRRADFVPAALPGFDEYLTRATRLVTVPLSTLLPLLEVSRGRCLAISSAALAGLPAEWPHYVTAKSAVEGLLRWAAANHPEVGFLTARPGALLTDQMTTPSARDLAAAVEPTAAALVRRLLDPSRRRRQVEMISTPCSVSPAGQDWEYRERSPVT